jgi:hypothetical protein
VEFFGKLEHILSIQSRGMEPGVDNDPGTFNHAVQSVTLERINVPDNPYDGNHIPVFQAPNGALVLYRVNGMSKLAYEAGALEYARAILRLPQDQDHPLAHPLSDSDRNTAPVLITRPVLAP